MHEIINRLSRPPRLSLSLPDLPFRPSSALQQERTSMRDFLPLAPCPLMSPAPRWASRTTAREPSPSAGALLSSSGVSMARSRKVSGLPSNGSSMTLAITATLSVSTRPACCLSF
jgi:hypothetical protein